MTNQVVIANQVQNFSKLSYYEKHLDKVVRGILSQNFCQIKLSEEIKSKISTNQTVMKIIFEKLRCYNYIKSNIYFSLS